MWPFHLKSFTTALRAAVWRQTPTPPSVGLRTLAICTLLAFSANLVDQYFSAGEAGHFSPYGLNADLAYSFVALAVPAAFVSNPWRMTVLAILAILACLGSLAHGALGLIDQSFVFGLVAPGAGERSRCASCCIRRTPTAVADGSGTGCSPS